MASEGIIMILLSNRYLPMTPIGIEGRENGRVFKRVNAFVHTRDGISISHSHDIEPAVVTTEPPGFVCHQNQYNWGSPG